MLPHYVRPLFHAEQTCCPGEVVGGRRQDPAGRSTARRQFEC